MESDLAKTRMANNLKESKFLRLVVAGVIATLAFNAAMYTDIVITGIPLNIPTTIGQIVLGENIHAEVTGQIIHLVNGIGLTLLFGYVAVPVSKKIIRLPTLVYAIIFSGIVTVVGVWFGMLPTLGAGIAGLDIAPEVPAMTMFRHVVFGIVLGLIVRSKVN